MSPAKYNDAVTSPDVEDAAPSLAVFKLPPVDQAPTGTPVLNSSVAADADGSPPLKANANVLLTPAPEKDCLPTLKSATSVQFVPFQDSVNA